MPIQIQVRVDSRHLVRQLSLLLSLCSALPQRRARKLQRKALRLLHVSANDQRPVVNRSTRGANDFAFRLSCDGLDQLIAAALKAGQRNV